MDKGWGDKKLENIADVINERPQVNIQIKVIGCSGVSEGSMRMMKAVVAKAAPAIAAPGVHPTQYHAQDELANYEFGYQNPNSAPSPALTGTSTDTASSRR